MVVFTYDDRELPDITTAPPASVADVLPPNDETTPVVVKSPLLPTSMTSDPLAFTLNGFAVDAATVEICTRFCAPDPPVAADVSLMENAVCDAVVCAQFHVIGLFPLAMVDDPPAAVTAFSDTPMVAQVAFVLDDATSV